MASQLRTNGLGSGGTDGYSGGPLDLWNQTHDSKQEESGIFYTLCACYALVSMVALNHRIGLDSRSNHPNQCLKPPFTCPHAPPKALPLPPLLLLRFTLNFHCSELLAAAILQALTAYQLFLAPPQLTATSVPSVAITSPVPHSTVGYHDKDERPLQRTSSTFPSSGATHSYPNESSRIWLDNPKSFPLDEFCRQWIVGRVDLMSAKIELNFAVRAVLFGLYRSVLHLRPKVSFFLLIPLVQPRLLLQSKIVIPMLPEAVTLEMMLMDIPGLLFFSTYTLLVLFWAEIYHQARSLPVDKLRPAYFIINGLIYFIQVCIWIYMRLTESSAAIEVAKLFFSVVSFCAALGFVIYGGRLFIMLRRFPIESRGRQKKLHEQESTLWTLSIAGWLCYGNLLYLLPDKMYYGEFLLMKLTVCKPSSPCVIPEIFLLAFVGLSAFDEDVDVDVLDHPILDLIYYMVVEIFPSALVLFILRKLPPKRVSDQYHPINGYEQSFDNTAYVVVLYVPHRSQETQEVQSSCDVAELCVESSSPKL
ncbi:LOW QUALITY PROTEIN: hypothetical protein RJ639_041087 [Escallonia herrerae]|uniref:THH1/TOM1/TOM3 domain-containing protein n=1 Tax=Escallonia herrerae TaxID=1293975 RepID=A0AA89BCB7_9ASTE|nr:LOW QUALITY PROTEIN: hypothetical protein RJ639_041087 [Escallonia herrerae]